MCIAKNIMSFACVELELIAINIINKCSCFSSLDYHFAETVIVLIDI